MVKTENMKLTKKEIEVIINLIDGQQFDGGQWSFEGISLTKLRKKLYTQIKASKKSNLPIYGRH